MKILRVLLIPITLACVIASLLLSLNLGGSIPEGQLVPLMLGLIAYGLAIFCILLSIRPKVVEKGVGLPVLYSMHGVFAITLMVAALVHIISELTATKDFVGGNLAFAMGFVAYVLLALATFSGIFKLSSRFIKKNKKKREVGLWMHRASLLAVIIIFVHMSAIEFVRENIALLIVAALWCLLAVVGSIVKKIVTFAGFRFEVVEASMANPSVHRIVLKPLGKKAMDYRPGQYAFLRFVKSELPKESHPFSFVGSPLSDGDKIEFLIKESGDYTKKLGAIKVGDVASIEGPFGSLLDGKASFEAPLVLLAGGIGVTPMLSIIKGELARDPERKITLAWGLSTKDDAVSLEVLDKLKAEHSGFSYSLIFSKEEVEGHDKGRIDGAYLDKLRVSYDSSLFLICGPAPMMKSAKSILKEKGVDDKRIRLEEFSF